MEADEIDLFAATVPGNFQQIENAEKTGFARQLGRYVREADGLNRIHFDFAFFHAVMPACFYPRILPDTSAARDFSATNAFTEAPGEHHGKSLQSPKGIPGIRGEFCIGLTAMATKRAVADGECQ